MTSAPPKDAVNGDISMSKCEDFSPNIPRDYHPDERVEPIPKRDFPHHLYPRWIGHKFKPEGSVLEYPGNTVLSHLPFDSDLHRALRALYHDIQKQDFAGCYTFLPPNSWHMTIYEGVSDQIRLRDSWPGDLALNSSLKACHAHVASQLADFESGLEAGMKMNITGFEPLDDGIALKLLPATPDGERALRELRDRLSERLKILHPGHANYSFHMGFSYLLRPLTGEDQASIEHYLKEWQTKLPRSFVLEPPAFCVYDDMYAFRRIFFLD